LFGLLSFGYPEREMSRARCSCRFINNRKIYAHLKDEDFEYIDCVQLVVGKAVGSVFCEHDNEPSVSTIGGEFLDKLSNSTFSKKNYNLRSYIFRIHWRRQNIAAYKYFLSKLSVTGQHM
jgi:hypothetical protein